ncbi:MAG: element excision factor XisH family protein [Candidatus Parabeggiatoa sp.]|nr:element excision factor XisH family protein [Candidatus Parabeggiatoa sp.]
MPAKDVYHDTVKNALIKESWTITRDQMLIRFGGFDMYIDLGAEQVFAAEKEGQKIAVEVKSFVSGPFISEFHTAVGQVMNYRSALKRINPECILYLAIPRVIYKTYFMRPFVQAVIEDYQIKYIVYHVQKEEIVKWQM